MLRGQASLQELLGRPKAFLRRTAPVLAGDGACRAASAPAKLPPAPTASGEATRMPQQGDAADLEPGHCPICRQAVPLEDAEAVDRHIGELVLASQEQLLSCSPIDLFAGASTAALSAICVMTSC